MSGRKEREKLPGIEFDKLTEVQKKIVGVISNELTRRYPPNTEGTPIIYPKSRNIAERLGLTPKEVGTNIGTIVNYYGGKILLSSNTDYREINIMRWSYSNSTTWCVSSHPIK